MVKLIVGVRGTGKTKTLIEMVNAAVAESKGSVICIEKGNTLNYDITHKARLIDVDEYFIEDAQSLYGFIAGISASNHDITDLFIDATLKVCGYDITAFEVLVAEVAKLAEKAGFNVTMTASMPVEDCSEAIKQYI